MYSTVRTSGRQYPLVGRSEFTYEDLASGVEELMVDLPAGAVPVGGRVVVLEAWDSATSDELVVGDSQDADRYTASAIDLSAVGVTELDNVAVRYAVGDVIRSIWTGTGDAPTQGHALLIFEYILSDRAHEAQPVRAE